MAQLKAIPARAQRFFQLHRDRRRLVLEAAVTLSAIRLAFAVLGYRRMVPHFGFCSEVRACDDAEAITDPAVIESTRSVVWAVEAAARHLPVETVCLHQALAARRMLRRRGVSAVMYFGLEPGKRINELQTHAWLRVGNLPGTGYPEAARCQVFARFQLRPETQLTN